MTPFYILFTRLGVSRLFIFVIFFFIFFSPTFLDLSVNLRGTAMTSTNVIGQLCGMNISVSNSSLVWPPLGDAFPSYRIFEYLKPTDLRILSGYIDGRGLEFPIVHKLHNVTLCSTLNVGHHSIAALIIDEDGKAIDISSKFMTLFSMSGGYYPIDIGPHLKTCLTRARTEAPSQYLSGPSFFGFDSFIGMPSHHYEDLLHNIGTREINCLQDVPLLLPVYNNRYYNMSIALANQFAGPVNQFLPDTVIRLQTLYITQPYHTLTPLGRLFVDNGLVPKIFKLFKGTLKTFEKIAILKLASHSSLQHSGSRSHLSGDSFSQMMDQEKIHLLDASNMTQAEVIFYLNSARYVLLSWGATLSINFHVWLSTLVRSSIDVVVVCHPGYSTEYAFLSAGKTKEGSRTRYAYVPGYDVNLPNFNGTSPGRAAKFILDVENLDTLSIVDLQFNNQKAENFSSCYAC